MKIKTQNLIGSQLDWAVELAKGTHWSTNGYFVFGHFGTGEPQRFDPNPEYRYSSEWAAGGPIIERESISTIRCNYLYFPKGNGEGSHWEAYYRADIKVCTCYGPTPLVAAMRCFVASKLGAEVEVPDQITT